MCDFCKTIRKQITPFGSNERWEENYLYKDENKINIYAGSYDPMEYGVLENVKFCPYCGRKLS